MISGASAEETEMEETDAAPAGEEDTTLDREADFPPV